jgi:MFS transporter, DHA2 family, methylenomycin A resistance protein
LLVILSLSGLIGAVIEVRSLGLAHPLVYGGIILALVAGAMFMSIETWAKTPMIPLSLFRRRGFGPAILFGALVNLSYYGVIFVLSLYLQKALGYSARQAGLAFIPLTASFILSNMASGWMTGRTGPRFPMVLGGLIGAFGYALLSPLGAQATFLNMLPGFVLIPFGIGLGVPAMTTAILSSVDSSWAGTVSALLNAARQTGGAIGVAAFGALLGGDLPDQIIAGLTTVTWSAAVLAGAAALIAFRIPPSVQAGNEEVVSSQCQ